MSRNAPLDDHLCADLDDHAAQILADYLPWAHAEYLTRWGRPMVDGDPLFPDWDGPEPAMMSPARVEVEMVDAMELAGLDGALIYAYQQSGILLSETNEHLVDPDAAAEWHSAIARYDSLHDQA